MTGRVRRLAEHLATMETGWRQYAWAIAAGLFTALGATAYAVEQPAYGAGFFVLAVLLLVGSGWSRWYLRTHPDRPGADVIGVWLDETRIDLKWTAEQEALAEAFFVRTFANGRYHARGIWLGPAATSEPSPPSTDFPGVKGGEIHSTEDGAHPDLINLDTGDEYEWVGEGYAHEGDHDFAWSREDLLKTGDRLVEVDSLDMADLLELRERYADGTS